METTHPLSKFLEAQQRVHAGLGLCQVRPGRRQPRQESNGFAQQEP